MDTFLYKADSSEGHVGIRLIINYVTINKTTWKRPPKLYQTKMKICYGQCYIDSFNKEYKLFLLDSEQL